MAVIARTAAGFAKFKAVGRGARVALVAPASPLGREDFDAGVAELRKLGFDPVYDERVFHRTGFLAGTAAVRAANLNEWWSRGDVDAVLAVRGGYGSVEVLESLDLDRLRDARVPFIGYSDLTSIHAFLTTHRIASVHGPMIDGRLARGHVAYDHRTFLQSLSPEPLGELSPEGLDAIRHGEASGPLCGGTFTQLLASLGTPAEFRPPDGHVLFIDDVNERPYKLHRMLTQWRLAGRFRHAAAVVFGQMPGCDEPGGSPKARDVAAECLREFHGPVLWGFPSGHTTTAQLSVPFGVNTRVVGNGHCRLVLDEAAAEAP